MTRFSRTITEVVAVALLTLSSLAALQGTARAQLDGDRLAGSRLRMADRVQLLREEARERRQEIRERAERLRSARKGARGQHAERVPADPDRSPAALQAGRGALPAGASHAFAVPANALANDKSGDPTGASSPTQAEQSIAFLGQDGLCAWNDGEGAFLSPADFQGWSYTTNGGATWTDGGVPPKSGSITTWSSDPVVTVNEKTGEFYYCGLTDNGTTQNGVAVARGHFSGSSFVWDGVTQVAVGSNTTSAYDKEWVAADSLTGNVYVTFTLFTTTSADIWFSRSLDAGGTWGAATLVSKSWEAGFVSGSRPAVGPGGEVYVTYNALGAVDADSMKVARSLNNGASFADNVVAGAVLDNYFTGAPGFNRGRAVTFPSIAVDRSTGPNRGHVYLGYQTAVDFYLDTFGSTALANSKNEVENNASYGNATPFTPGQTLRGAIAASDVDNFKFNAVQGTTYVFYADSVKTTTFKYTMRLYCPNDTTVVSRLALSSDGSSSSSVNVHALIVWTAPTTGTYYLRMQNSTSTGGYRIRTTTHVPTLSDGGRDARDAVVISSPNGVTGWTAPVRVNDDAALYDNWLPEVAVSQDGKPYAMWFDWRDTPATCFGGSNIYVTRSDDGGATWAANQLASTAVTPNWTQVINNLAPNQGDYNGMYGGDCIGLAWADGRLGDSDVWTTRIDAGYTLTGMPADQGVDAGNALLASATINNLNTVFGNTYSWTLTLDHAWPGYPAAGTVSAGAGGSTPVPVSIVVPDSAANGEVVHACLTTSLNGAEVLGACFSVTVIGTTGVPPVPAVAEFALRQVFPSPAREGFSVSFSLRSGAPATLDVLDLAGRRVISREVGTMGAGPHTLSLAAESLRLPIGIYAVRLSQSGRVATSKVSVVR